MDAFSSPADQLFQQLSRLSDGDHSVFIRTDAQAFLEYHRGGKSNVFTSHVAALMPNVVIKLHTPLVPSIISSVQPQQGRPVQRDPHTRLYVADGLTDIIGLVKNHKAATLREDATLVAWSNNSLHEALTSLLAVYKELHGLLAKYDPARAVDPVPFFGDSLMDTSMGMDCFDQFIHNYEPSTTVGDKPQDFSTFLPGARNTLPPLGTFESVNSIDTVFSSAFRTSYVSSRSASGVQSPMLGDSPSTYMSSSISRLRIDNTPLGSMSTFSPGAMSFTFSSPSASSSSASDGTLSTPMTIAPSVLSSPNSWESTPLMDSPSLPVILETPLEENFDEESASHFLNGSELPDSQPMISPVLPQSPHERHATTSVVDSPKRKRSSPPPPKEAPAAPKSPSKARAPAAGKARSRRSSPATSPKTSKASASRPQKPLPAPKKAKAAPAPPAAPKRGVCPLPGRVVKSSRRSPSVSSSAPEAVPEPAAVTRTFLHVSDSLGSDDESEHEHADEDVESDFDYESEYEADRSSDDEDDFRPYKRTRSASRPIVSALDDSSRTQRKARSQKINAAMGVGSRKSSSTRRHKGKKEKEPRTLCTYFEVCGKDFSRYSDMVRHAECSCKGNPNPKKRRHSICPVCDFVASRHDAALRHRGSDNCRQRLKAKLERLARGEEEEAPDAAMDEEQEEVAVDRALDEDYDAEEAVVAEAEAGEQ